MEFSERVRLSKGLFARSILIIVEWVVASL